MAPKTLLFAVVLIAGVAAPMAQAQVPGMIRINGTVPCSIAVNTSAVTAPFSNASVQLQCGGSVITSTTTNSSGAFTFMLSPITILLSSLLTTCKLVVTTPLATCNTSLPISGVLQSGMQLVNSVVSGVLNVTTVIPTGFSLILA